MKKVLVLLPLLLLGACNAAVSKECMQSRALQSSAIKQRLNDMEVDAGTVGEVANAVAPVDQNACTAEETKKLDALENLTNAF